MVISNIIDFVSKVKMVKHLRVKSLDVYICKNVYYLVKIFLNIGIFKRVLFLKVWYKGFSTMRLYIHYRGDGNTVFKDLKVIYKPSYKVHFSLNKLIKFKEMRFDSNIIILSTKRGLLTDLDCFFYRIGGIPLLSIKFF